MGIWKWAPPGLRSDGKILTYKDNNDGMFVYNILIFFFSTRKFSWNYHELIAILKEGGSWINSEFRLNSSPNLNKCMNKISTLRQIFFYRGNFRLLLTLLSLWKPALYIYVKSLVITCSSFCPYMSSAIVIKTASFWLLLCEFEPVNSCLFQMIFHQLLNIIYQDLSIRSH